MGPNAETDSQFTASSSEQPVHLVTGIQAITPSAFDGYPAAPSTAARHPEDEALWAAVKQSLFAKNPNNRLLDVWFSPTTFLGAEQTPTGRRFVLGVQNNVYKYWIEQNFFDQICAEFNLHHRAPFQVVLECASPTQQTQDPLSVRNLEEALVAHDRSVERAGEKLGYSNEQAPVASRPTHDERRDFLKPEFCFNTFVVGAYNEFAHAACFRIAENPGGANGYNPLFICGPTGMGKTHLLNAVGNHIRQTRPELQICYVSAERFLTDFRRSVQSVKRADMDAFKQRYREKPDVLLMDDIYVLGHGEMAQEEFFNTLNHLFLRGKQVVVASDRMPRDIDGLQDRIRTRLEGGLIADVKMPDLDTRIAILRYKAERLRFRLSDEVVSYIARISKRSIRELEGNLNVAKVWSDFYGRELTLEVAKQIMSIRDQSTNLTIEDVQRLASEHYRINVKDLKSPSRARPYVTARQLAMYLIHKNLGKSLVEIGRAFGNRDHTTVLNALRRIEDQLSTDPEIKRDLGELQTRIHNLTGV
jgi:chromosomal replication initiator protein